MHNQLRKILVIRNDRLGDFMLAFPSFILLKQALPATEIHALVPSYTEQLADACSGIDRVVIDPGPRSGFFEQLKLLRQLRRNRYDAVITLYSTARIGLCVFLAQIPYRLAPATKIAQIFYNKRLGQHRSRSQKPEYAYNTDLCMKFLADFAIKTANQPTPPYLSFAEGYITELRVQFCKKHGVDPDRLLVFVHSGSAGSASNLTLGQYGELVRLLRSNKGHTIVLSAGPGENRAAEELATSLSGVPHVVYHSHEGLRRFAEHIQFADLFISGSTGPLHIAGTLNRPTVAFYPRRRSATALRWQTLNTDERRLDFSPPASAKESDMQSIDLGAAAELISSRLLMG